MMICTNTEWPNIVMRQNGSKKVTLHWKHAFSTQVNLWTTDFYRKLIGTNPASR